MSISEKIKWLVLPSLLVIGIGILEIRYPNAMHGFDDGYTGRGVAGLILLLIELFLMITWGKIGGIVAISLGILAVTLSFFPNSKQTKEETTENLETARTYIQTRLDNQKP